MKLTEYSKLANLEYKNYIVLVRFGNFYKCFDDDALIVGYLLDYKVKDNIVAFPLSSLGKVIITLKNNNVSAVIVKEQGNIMNVEVMENNYKKILEEAKEEAILTNKMKDLGHRMRLLLKDDLNNYEKIRDYLIKLN